MTITMCEPRSTRTLMAIRPSQINESKMNESGMSEPMLDEQVFGQLLRGEDASLLERIEPLVRECSVTLDLTGVDRIDAAGISTLVALYSSACKAGHCFSVSNASPHVAQILAIVGLDRLLLSHNAVQNLPYGRGFRRSAA